jgi:hypothetical protein
MIFSDEYELQYNALITGTYWAQIYFTWILQSVMSHLYRIVPAHGFKGVGPTDQQLARPGACQNADVVLTVLLQAQTHLINKTLIKTLRTRTVTTFHLTGRNPLFFCFYTIPRIQHSNECSVLRATAWNFQLY